MRLSIVSTLYRSSASIDEFCRRASEAARAYAGEDYELVLVNDGSPDDSLEKAVRHARSDPHVVVVDLARNFGHHKAMMTGLAHARGERVFLIDSDLEEDPAWLRDFAAQLQHDDCDVVFGVQAWRKGGVFERWSGLWFYRLFRLVTGVPLPDNVVVARMMTQRYVQALLLHEEREVFLAGLWAITGFEQRARTVDKRSRRESTYTLRRKISLLVNSITSFSSAPLIAIFYTGAAISLVAGLYIGYLVFHWLFLATPPSGWTSVMASIWLLGGLIILFIGVIGIYLSKVFSEAKRRPYTIVRQLYGRDRPEP
ncbi:MAG: glycosyltransferase [Burkholderiales bacterium]